jgi:thiol:disulfide interchange protein DsbD
VWLLYVFGAQTGADGLTWLLAFLLVLGFFCWLHGTFLNLMSGRSRVYTIWILTVVGCGFAYQKVLHPVLFPPPRSDLARPGLQPAFSEHAEVTKGGIVWAPFSSESLETSIEDGKTVFLDFTADWCLTCKVNERTVLADSEIEDAFRDNEVVTLKGDWTRKDPEITEIIKRHNRPGVPFYAIYPAGRPHDVIVLPEIINKKIVLESLKRAGPSEPEA